MEIMIIKNSDDGNSIIRRSYGSFEDMIRFISDNERQDLIDSLEIYNNDYDEED